MDQVRQLATAWRRRSGRGEYWISVAVMLVLTQGLKLAFHTSVLASLICLPFWMVVGARRLHDFGASAGWGLLPFGAAFAVSFVHGFMVRAGIGQPISPQALGPIITGASVLIMIVIGAWPGAKGENRYGPASGAPAPAAAV